MEFSAHGSGIQQKEIQNSLHVEFDGSNGNHKYNDGGSVALGSVERDFPIHEETCQLDDIVVSTSINNNERGLISQDKFESENLTPGCLRMDSLAMGALTLGATLHSNGKDFSLLDTSLEQEETVDVISNVEESLEASSPPTSSSEMTENEGAAEHEIVPCFEGKMELLNVACSDDYMEADESINMEVVVIPDFLFYGNRLSNHSQLTFSTNHIKLEDIQDLSASGSNMPTSSQWEVDAIVHIESRWSESVETGLVKLQLCPTAVAGIENANCSSDIMKLTFGVSDPQWRKKEQKIVSLTARYKAKWNSMLDTANEKDDLMGQNSMFFLKRFFTNIDEPFEDVIYPKGDPDAVSIGKRDIELLQPETFINDTIIDFYIKYLKNKIQPEDRHRYHFFNSFFFRKLADLDKNPGSALEGRAAFLRVRKWTRKVNIFEKDYIFIPVNFNLHWSLIVICHPGEVASFKDEDINESPNVPCILHMDSIKGSHKGLKNLAQSYLWEEWKERNGESSEDVSLRFLNLRFVHLELPQQENSFDCGLFLLHYVELFLEEAPVNFSPFKITKFSNFLNSDWFPPFEASHKRSMILKLIFEIINDHSLKIPPIACSSQIESSKFQVSAGKEQAVTLLSERRSPAKQSDIGNTFCSTVNGGIEIELLPSSSPHGVHCDKETGIIFREFLEQGDTARSSLDAQCEPVCMASSFQKFGNTMSQMEEDSDTGEQFFHLSSDRGVGELQIGIAAEACPAPKFSEDVAALEASWSQEIVMQPKQHEDGDSSSQLLSCRLQGSLEVEETEAKLVPFHCTDFAGSNEQVDETEAKPRSVSPDTPALAAGVRPEMCAVEDSVVELAVAESKESGHSSLPFQQNHSSPHQDDETMENNRPLRDIDVQLSSGDLEALEQQANNYPSSSSQGADATRTDATRNSKPSGDVDEQSSNKCLEEGVGNQAHNHTCQDIETIEKNECLHDVGVQLISDGLEEELKEQFHNHPSCQAAETTENSKPSVDVDMQWKSEGFQEGLINETPNHPSSSCQDFGTTENGKPLVDIDMQMNSEGLKDDLKQQAQNDPSSSCQDVEKTEDTTSSRDINEHLNNEGLEDAESERQPKRLKVEPPEGEKRITRSVARDSHS